MDKTVKLNNGVLMPRIGLGVFRAQDGMETVNAVKWAIEAGYRHIDTAAVYGNEESVGKGIRESRTPRSELFITTKLWNDDIRAGRTAEAFKESLERLGLDYIDLYLIHWPADGYEKAWKVMEALYKEGRARAIGVSNFHVHHLDKLARHADIVPAVDQVECHPYLSQTPLRGELAARGIACEAWSPLGGGHGKVLVDKTVAAIASDCGRTPAQVILRWDLQHGIITIPKSVHKDRIISNLDVFSFELTGAQMNQLDALNLNQRVGADPENFNF